MQFLKKKAVIIPIAIILFFVFMVNAPKLAGVINIAIGFIVLGCLTGALIHWIFKPMAFRVSLVQHQM